MNPEEKILAESIRSGKYFEESRGWFQVVCIGPISERTFFLVIALLAALVAFASVSAMMALLPITERPPVYIRAGDRMDDTVKTLVPINASKHDLNAAMTNFFVTHYVKARESYFASTYLSNANFIRQQSDDAVYATYIAQNDVTNPTSPAALLGQIGQRVLTIHKVDINNDTALVKFTATNILVDNENKTRWTARIQFRYTGMKVDEKKNAETGVLEITTTDPKFQVVKYELEQAK